MHRLRIIPLLVTPLFILSACQDREGMLRQHFESNKEAKAVLESIDGPDVTGVEAALLRGAEEAEENGNYVKSLQYWIQLVDQNEDNPAYQLSFADALRKTGAYNKAIAQYNLLRDSEEYKAAALEGIGLALMAQGEYEQAGDHFSEVMEVDAARWRSINAIGILFTIREMYPEARQYFAEALALNPSSVPVRNNLALMEAMDKQYDEAERLLNEAQKMAVNKSDQQMQVAMNLGLIHAIQGDLKRAETIVQPWLSESELFNNMGYYAHVAKDDQMATSYLNMALTQSDKHYAKAWKNLDSLNKLVKKSPGKSG